LTPGSGELRRYPDRVAIAVALLDEHERALQEQLLRGPPPLGPAGRPPGRLLRRHGPVAGGPRAPGPGGRDRPARFATGADGFWRARVRALLAEGGRGQDEGRLDALVDALLAPLAPELYRYQR